MLDIQLLRKNINNVAIHLATRGFKLNIDQFKTLENNRRILQTNTEKFQALHNMISKQIGVKKKSGIDITALMSKAKKQEEEMKLSATRLNVAKNELRDWLLALPNVPHESVQIGTSEVDNIEIRRVGIPRNFDFLARDHVNVGRPLGLDIETGTKISGARFTLLRGQIAQLHRAIGQYMLNVHVTKHGYTEMYIPYIVNADALIGTGQLPKFESDMFRIERNWEEQCSITQYLISTSEITMANTVRESILDWSILPIKMTAHSPCFRSEAGSYGRDTHGMIRQHQFDKVEMVQIVEPSQSYLVLEEMVKHAEAILQDLKLPYRVVMLCTGDLGFSSSKTYDLEVWMPSQNTYREISSCSNTESFQARRMQSRYRTPRGTLEFVHILNGSALAVGRTLVAILENYQNADGSVTVPAALRPYLDWKDVLSV